MFANDVAGPANPIVATEEPNSELEGQRDDPFLAGGSLPAVLPDPGGAPGPSASDQAFGPTVAAPMISAGPAAGPGEDLLRSAGEERTGRADLDADRFQPGLDDDTVAQRRDELKAVFGIDANFQQLLEQAGEGNMRDTVDRELPKMAALGARFVRVNVPVDQPARYGDYKQVLEGFDAYNQQHPDAPVKIDLLANPGVTDYSLDGAAGQGQACATAIKQFVAFCGDGLVASTVASVELFNEPEAEWKDESVGLDTAGAAQRDSNAMNAGMAGLEGQLPPGVAITPGAHEWDPASESAVLAKVAAQFDDVGGDPGALQASAAQAIADSSFAVRLSQFASDYRARVFPDTDPGEVVQIPIALHIYNSPVVSRGLMDAVAAIAARDGINCTFAVRVTEFQIDALAHGNPSSEQLADGVVDLGVQVMDAAAQHADRLQIQQMIAFSYHHRIDREESGTDFGLQGNEQLPEVLG